MSLYDEDGFINDLFRKVTVDFANAKLYSLSYASNTVTIKRYRIPVFDKGICFCVGRRLPESVQVHMDPYAVSGDHLQSESGGGEECG